jgi:hypothetical protein
MTSAIINRAILCGQLFMPASYLPATGRSKKPPVSPGRLDGKFARSGNWKPRRFFPESRADMSDWRNKVREIYKLNNQNCC